MAGAEEKAPVLVRVDRWKATTSDRARELRGTDRIALRACSAPHMSGRTASSAPSAAQLLSLRAAAAATRPSVLPPPSVPPFAWPRQRRALRRQSRSRVPLMPCTSHPSDRRLLAVELPLFREPPCVRLRGQRALRASQLAHRRRLLCARPSRPASSSARLPVLDADGRVDPALREWLQLHCCWLHLTASESPTPEACPSRPSSPCAQHDLSDSHASSRRRPTGSRQAEPIPFWVVTTF